MSKSKQEIINELISRGYNTIDEQGVITVLCDETIISVSDCMNKLREELKTLGYNGSYGVKAKNGKYKEV